MSHSRTTLRLTLTIAAFAGAMLLVSGRAIASGHGAPKEGGHGGGDHGGGHDAGGGEGHGGGHGAEPAAEGASEDEQDGVKFGEFRIRSYYPVEAQKSTVTFALYASVPEGKLADMREFVKIHENKLRDQVITTTRLTPLAEFDQSELTAFRRRILMRLRRSLPELQIDDIFVSDFQLAVKSL